MSPYHIVGILLIIGTICEQFIKKTPKYIFICSFAILSLMLVMRYGQGTDYFGYYFNFVRTPERLELSEAVNVSIHGEIGWILLCSWSKQMGISFEVFVMIVSIIELVMLWRFLQKYCIFKSMALLLSYHTLYLTYMFSALRQGLVTTVFLGCLLEWYLKKKYVKYIIGTFFCTLIHTVSFIFLIVFLIPLINQISRKNLLICLVIFWGIGITLSLNSTQILLRRILPVGAVTYMSSTHPSFLAIGERIVSFIVVSYFYWIYREKNSETYDLTIDFFMQMYTVGISFYGLTSWNYLIATRTFLCFKVLEICIISSIAPKIGKARETLATFCLLLSAVLYFKNINSYLTEKKYQSLYNMWNYPYISILEKDNIGDYQYGGWTPIGD